MTTNPEQLAVLIGQCQKAQQQMGEIPHITVPEGFRVESLEHLLPRPARARGVFTTSDPSSWARYVDRFANKAESYVFYTDESAVAILDAHGPSGAGWCEHLAVLDANPEGALQVIDIPTFRGKFSDINLESE